jgi:hypothetical protein
MSSVYEYPPHRNGGDPLPFNPLPLQPELLRERIARPGVPVSFSRPEFLREDIRLARQEASLRSRHRAVWACRTLGSDDRLEARTLRAVEILSRLYRVRHKRAELNQRHSQKK